MPFPANYGGVIDVYYKLYWLKKAGVKIILHCFTYGRKKSPELELLCEKVFYYERKTGFVSNLSLLPYNVKSRTSVELENNLLQDQHPILFEVLHTCYLMSDSRFANRKKIYRHSNIEHDYYTELSRSERNVLKKIYLKIESFKLQRFEPILKFADLILAVNQRDTDYFKRNYPTVKSVYLPSFHPNETLQIKTGTGDFILFHGNLSVSENYEAADWLIKNVFSKISFKCVIAGLNPPDFLRRAAENYSNIEVIPNPSESEMTGLVKDAQAHLLYTAQPTGLKLKLLNVLYKGRFIICNKNMVAGTTINENDSLFICDSPNEFIEMTKKVIQETFNTAMITSRESQVLVFDNERNAEKLITEVFQ